MQCGNCKAGTPCDKINGSCTDGCADLYEPPFCTGDSSFFFKFQSYNYLPYSIEHASTFFFNN